MYKCVISPCIQRSWGIRNWSITEGKRKRGRPKNTWRRTVEGELKTLHHTWGTVQKLAQNIQGWSTFVAALHASRHNRHE